MKATNIQIGNEFYIERIEHLSEKEKKAILNALSIYCSRTNYTQAIIEQLYNTGLSSAITLRMKVQEKQGIHIGVFKVDYYKNISREKKSFEKIKAGGGTGSSLFMNTEAFDYNKKNDSDRQILEECDYKSVIEYTAVDGLSESIIDLRTLLYKYYNEFSVEKFTKDFSIIINNIFVSNFGLNGILYSNQKYSNKYYDIHFDRNLQKPPREVFGSEWPSDIYLKDTKWIQDELITKETKEFYFRGNINKDNKMLKHLQKGKRYLFRLDFLKYDISDSKRVQGAKFKEKYKFIMPGKYRVDFEIEMEENERNDFLYMIDRFNIIYIEGTYVKNKIDILEEAVNKLGYKPKSTFINFSKNLKFPNIIPKIETFLNNPLLKVFMECLSFNDPNFNNILIAENQSVKLIDYALISQSGLFYDLSRFETIMRMEFIFDVLYPKYKNNEEIIYKILLMVEDWILFDKEIKGFDNLDKEIQFLYIFILIVRNAVIELADMHYLHTFNEYKSGSFVREYIYSLMFFNISYLKFKHDSPKRKRIAFMMASYYMNKLEDSSFVSSTKLNERVFKTKRAVLDLYEIAENKTKSKIKDDKISNISIEKLLNIINSSKEEQINYFEKVVYKVKYANKLFDSFLEDYFADYETQLSRLFLNLSKEKDKPNLSLWLINKLNTLPTGQEILKFEILENCSTSSNPFVKNNIIKQLYYLAEYDLKTAIEIMLRLTKGLTSRTIIFIIFLLKCKNNDYPITLHMLSEVLICEIPTFLKYNVLDFLKKHYYKNKDKAGEILNYLSKEKSSKFLTELNSFKETLNNN